LIIVLSADFVHTGVINWYSTWKVVGSSLSPKVFFLVVKFCQKWSWSIKIRNYFRNYVPCSWLTWRVHIWFSESEVNTDVFGYFGHKIKDHEIISFSTTRLWNDLSIREDKKPLENLVEKTLCQNHIHVTKTNDQLYSFSVYFNNRFWLKKSHERRRVVVIL